MTSQSSNTDQGSWYAVQVRPRWEKHVSLILEGKGYEHFLPMRSVASRKSNRRIDLPLFPGYLFCRFNPQLPGLIVTTPGVVRIVRYGNIPTAILDTEIESIRALANSKLPLVPYPYLHEGNIVRISEGPLTGITGRIIARGKRDLLVVSVGMLQRSVAVHIDARSVVPTDANGVWQAGWARQKPRFNGRELIPSERVSVHRNRMG